MGWEGEGRGGWEDGEREEKKRGGNKVLMTCMTY